jgi:hypothetical protein
VPPFGVDVLMGSTSTIVALGRTYNFGLPIPCRASSRGGALRQRAPLSCPFGFPAGSAKRAASDRI